MRIVTRTALLGLLSIFLSVPLSMGVYSYGLFKPLLYLPFLLFPAVLVYGAVNVKLLVDKDQKKEAGALVIVLILLVAFALIALPLTFTLFRPVRA